MKDRAKLVSELRSEIMGPECPRPDSTIIELSGGMFAAEGRRVTGNLYWQPEHGASLQEVVFRRGERPARKYGVGRLSPQEMVLERSEQASLEDRSGYDSEAPSSQDVSGEDADKFDESEDELDDVPDEQSVAVGDEDFDISSSDVLRPASMAVTLCARIDDAGTLKVRLPRSKKFAWQHAEEAPFEVNGRYVKYPLSGLTPHLTTAWCRLHATPPECSVLFTAAELYRGAWLRKEVPLGSDCPLTLLVECAPRVQDDGSLVVTVVLRNVTTASSRYELESGSLFQSHFEVMVQGGQILPYPESPMPFDRLDSDEQSLALLYRDSKTWAIGHGCAAGWELDPSGRKATGVYADAMPVVELPSMTPDVFVQDGTPLRLSMEDLSRLDDNVAGPGWAALQHLVDSYGSWLEGQNRGLNTDLSPDFRSVGARHLARCGDVLARMSAGLTLLKEDAKVRSAFRLANASMLLQQIASKQLKSRALKARVGDDKASPREPYLSPLMIWRQTQTAANLGYWRAFQVGFLLMSLRGATDPISPDRDIVDLIWFPTGGGKTEAYLGVMAVHMFHQRLISKEDAAGILPRDGTNVLMRYTLRMLTTQQFQRAASLICSMEMLRRHGADNGFDSVPGGRFALGLWLGSAGSPNKIKDAEKAVREFKQAPAKNGNPMVLTECPWCRCGIGAAVWERPGKEVPPVGGMTSVGKSGPLLHCPDPECPFGGPPERKSTWLPIEVIDERIYANPPSLVIATADKFATMAYRPHAGAILGREIGEGVARLVRQPPGLIIQDELHLIAGPLGTIYGLYETMIEELCTTEGPFGKVRPKRIASTATIRGADQQVRGIFGVGSGASGHQRLQLFPSPGLAMDDSFFGRYARDENGALLPGRLYLGVHANGYSSVLTTQVRAFSRILIAVAELPEADRDPWWTLLAFYNSIRELGGAHTLVQSDIRSRLEFLTERAGLARRTIAPPHELTSRRTQAEIVGMLNDLAVAYGGANSRAIDVCLASNIIEVGVDIDRLSLMAVIGQPKTTAQYIQVTGRVGRRWQDRPGFVMTLYNPMRSRDRSHYEQFHSYHNRLYEKVEPTTATPFAPAAIDRAATGAALLWARQHVDSKRPIFERYKSVIEDAYKLLELRCKQVELSESVDAAVRRLAESRNALFRKFGANPQMWEKFPPSPSDEYLMLWPGQSYSDKQHRYGVTIPNAMRQVDRSAELEVSDRYSIAAIDLNGELA